MRTRLLLSLAVALLATSCKKADPEAGLPAATHTGANTAGCLVNGERFLATGYGSGLSRVGAMSGGFSFDSVYRVAFSVTQAGKDVDIMLFFRSQKVGTYLLNRTTQYYPQGSPRYILNHATYTVSNNTGELYVTDAQHTGQIDFTYADVQRGIGAGTFAFTAASTFDPRKTITVTNGRFDRKL